MYSEEKIVQIVKSVLPAVVSIVVAEEYEKLIKDKSFDSFIKQGIISAPPQEEDLPHTKEGKIVVGGGSGFIVDKNGLVLTNNHVVHVDNAVYLITTATDDTYPARVVAHDPISDIAILKIEEKGLPTITLGDSNNIELGQTVLSIGTALGEFQNTVSAGIISGLSRNLAAAVDAEGNLERLHGLIQTDAAINPGNSGGPLVNLKGEAIAINTAVVFGAQNLNFAIPINRAKRDLEELKKFGRIRRPFLGIRYININPRVKKRFNLPVDEGALVLGERVLGKPAVIPNSPAHKAGIKEGDVIIKINKSKIDAKKSIEAVLEDISPGDRVEIEIIRAGLHKKIVVETEERKI